MDKIEKPRWHIGWNGLEVCEKNELLKKSDGDVMYFNHSYAYKGAEEYIAARFRVDQSGEAMVAAIQRGAVLGLQFHPEKSQRAGLQLLARAITRLAV